LIHCFTPEEDQPEGATPEGATPGVDPNAPVNAPVTLLSMRFTERSICNDAVQHAQAKSYQSQHDASVHLLMKAQDDNYTVKKNKKSKKTHAMRKAGAILASMLGYVHIYYGCTLYWYSVMIDYTMCVCVPLPDLSYLAL
jgi:hypothetical protein